MTFLRQFAQPGAGGGFHALRAGKVDLTWDPIPPDGILSIPTGIFVAPPAGQYVWVPIRVEWVGKTLDGDKSVGMAVGGLHFHNGAGTPFDRLNFNELLLMTNQANTVHANDAQVDAAGEVGIKFFNSGFGAVGWARGTVLVGSPIALFQALTCDDKVHREVGGDALKIGDLGCAACVKPDAFGQIVDVAQRAGKDGAIGAIKRLGEAWVSPL